MFESQQLKRTVGQSFIVDHITCSRYFTTVNDMLGGIHNDIHNAATDQEAAGRVRLAFGDNWQTHHEQLKKDATALRDARITIKHSDPIRAEEHQYQDTLRREGNRAPKESDKKDFIAHVDRTGVNDDSKPGIMWLGTGWHDDKEYGRANRAGTALHEAVHAVLRGGDHMHNDGTTSKYIDSTVAGKLRESLPTDKYNEQVKIGDGCTSEIPIIIITF